MRNLWPILTNPIWKEMLKVSETVDLDLVLHLVKLWYLALYGAHVCARCFVCKRNISFPGLQNHHTHTNTWSHHRGRNGRKAYASNCLQLRPEFLNHLPKSCLEYFFLRLVAHWTLFILNASKCFSLGRKDGKDWNNYMLWVKHFFIKNEVATAFRRKLHFFLRKGDFPAYRLLLNEQGLPSKPQLLDWGHVTFLPILVGPKSQFQYDATIGTDHFDFCWITWTIFLYVINLFRN